MLTSNDFYTGENPKLAPNFKGPAEIIDINYTNTKVKIGNKIKVLTVEELKLFHENSESDIGTNIKDLNFNDMPNDGPITRAPKKLIKYKETAHLALLILNEESESEAFIDIDSLCDGPCSSCDAENHYFKNNPVQRKLIQKCMECEKFAELFIQLKKSEDKCYQLKRYINYACQHQ